MIRAKDILIISFVILSSSIQILCNHLNSDLSNDMIDNDGDSSTSSDSEELNEKNFEVGITPPHWSRTKTEEDCCNPNHYCDEYCKDNEKISYDSMFLLTVSEVILGTAIVMGLSALVTILLRICSRPRYVPNNADPNIIPDEFGRMGIRASLTSLQQRVMSKLRDRPPRYETRHNYEYQRRERTTRISVLNPGAAAGIAASSADIPPPAYESNDNSSLHELPPTYTIAIEDTGGILNQSFSNDETSVRCGTEASNSEIDISNRTRTSDNILHI